MYEKLILAVSTTVLLQLFVTGRIPALEPDRTALVSPETPTYNLVWIARK